MRDYWLTKYLLSAIGWGYLIVVLIALALVLWLVKGRAAKTVAVLVVLGLASILPIRGFQDLAKEKEAAEAYRVRLAEAQALFDERCKTAGEKIYKTVDKVEGVLLVKVRPSKINLSDQYAMDDPYGQENSGGDGYIQSFLAGRADAYWLTDKTTKGAYLFAEVVDPASKNITHYTAQSANKNGRDQLLLKSSVRPQQGARYAVDWQDESTLIDRANWIACGSVTVLDIANKEILGKRTGCMFDAGMGNTSGGRSPWAYARNKACPEPRRTPDGRALFDPVDRNFVEKVLKPSAEK